VTNQADRDTGRQFKDHFSAISAGYAAHRPTYPPALVECFASLVPAHCLVWEAGCGSGQLSTLLAERFERVIATDASHEQLAEAAPRANIEYRCARAEASGLSDSSIDLAVAAQAAHWFELERYYAEVRRVSRPGAIVALVSYDMCSIDAELDPLVDHFYGSVLGRHWPPERKHVESGYRSLPFPFEEIEAPPLTIEVEWTLAQFQGYIETWSAVRALVRSEGRAALELFDRELTRAWGDPSRTHSIRWPLGLRVGCVDRDG
jgi:SAM-dependent methyltransferase